MLQHTTLSLKYHIPTWNDTHGHIHQNWYTDTVVLISRDSVDACKHPCIDTTLYLPVQIHIATIIRDLQTHIFTNWDHDNAENRCNFKFLHPNLHFQAVVHTSHSWPGGTKFSSRRHSVFPATPESGHGSDAASVAGSHQERACEPRVGGSEVGRRLRADPGHWASWGALEWERENSLCPLSDCPYLTVADSETHEVVPHQGQRLAGSLQGRTYLLES